MSGEWDKERFDIRRCCSEVVGDTSEGVIANYKNQHLSLLLVTGNTPRHPQDLCASHHKFNICQIPHHIPATP